VICWFPEAEEQAEGLWTINECRVIQYDSFAATVGLWNQEDWIRYDMMGSQMMLVALSKLNNALVAIAVH
jgi:hypothetical protein